MSALHLHSDAADFDAPALFAIAAPFPNVKQTLRAVVGVPPNRARLLN
jgi:hypothetical protein